MSIRHLFLILTFTGICIQSQAQKFDEYAEIGLFGGVAYYLGDLNDEHFTLAQPGAAISYKYNLDRRFTLRGMFLYTELRGSDKLNSNDINKLNRNLHFRSKITELSAMVEFNFLPYETGNYRFPFSPYVFTGISFYQFNPQARTLDTDNPFQNDGDESNNLWVDLQELGTEGQQSSYYPEKDPYLLSQFSIPMGLGIKFSLGDKFSLSAEYGVRMTFTDYLDDVGGTYANPEILNLDNPLAASLSDRSINNDPNSIGNTDKLRANENKWNDWYVFTGLTLSYKIYRKPKVCQY